MTVIRYIVLLQIQNAPMNLTLLKLSNWHVGDLIDSHIFAHYLDKLEIEG